MAKQNYSKKSILQRNIIKGSIWSVTLEDNIPLEYMKYTRPIFVAPFLGYSIVPNIELYRQWLQLQP